MEISKPKGLNNTGNHCYFNSIVQALMAVPPFQQYINKHTYDLAEAFKNVHESGNILKIKHLLTTFMVKEGIYPLSANGQECSRETYDHLMNMIEECEKAAGIDEKLRDSFNMRRQTIIICKPCDARRNSPKDVPEISFECYEDEPVLPTKDMHYIESCLRCNISRPEDLNCDNCGAQMVKIRALLRVNDVILLVFPKSQALQNKIQMSTFDPNKPIVFNLKHGKKAIYKARSMVIHHGSQNGGHYLAHVKYGDKYYLCNDSNVSETGPFKMTPNTFMLFYSK